MKQPNWISNGTKKPYYLRKEISFSGAVAKATASVCGLGQFVFYVNGQKVGDHELDPGWTDYRKYMEYVDFDVTSLLVAGTNVLAAEVGNGWYCAEQLDPDLVSEDGGYAFHFPPFMPPNPNPYQPYGDCLPFAMQLTVEYTDGSTEVFSADTSWKTRPHAITLSNIYGSEACDGRLVPKGWNAEGFDDSDWTAACEATVPDVPLVLQFQPAIKVIHTYEGKLCGTVNGNEIYDLSQNISGLMTLTVSGKKGDVVRLYPAEKRDEHGDADQMAKNWMLIDNVITYVIGEDDVEETFRMTFTYFAGRYVRVEKPETVTVHWLAADAISSAWKTDGEFASSDERLVKIHDMIERTVEANMVSVHTDCPTIERFAWQEPNHLMAPSIFYLKDGRLLWKKFFLDMRMAQHTADDYFLDFEGNKVYPGDGLVPSQAPCYIPNVLPVPGMGSFYDIIPWGSALILGTRWYYKFYGDLEVVRENYDASKRYFGHLLTKVTDDGFINHGLGDWGNPDNELARENIETAFLYADADSLAQFAELLGQPEDAAYYRERAKEICENYNDKLLVQDENGRYCYRVFEHPDELFMTQSAEALPLFWGMVPDYAKADVEAAFKKTLDDKGAFVAGEVGLPYIIQTAAALGLHETIFAFITKETHPSYYAFVLDGETTLGEYWENNPRSHCHDMMGHIIEWFYNGLAGIQPLEPGFKKVLVKPYLPKSVDEVNCTYHSVNGDISVSMKWENGAVALDVKADEGISLTVDESFLKEEMA